MLAFTARLESTINLTPFMSLDYWRKLEYLKRTHASLGTAGKLYIERPT